MPRCSGKTRLYLDILCLHCFFSEGSWLSLQTVSVWVGAGWWPQDQGIAGFYPEGDYVAHACDSHVAQFDY